MSLYYYAPTKENWGWHRLPYPGITMLTNKTVLEGMDVLFVHKNDLNVIDKNDSLHKQILLQSATHHAREMVFFSGAACTDVCAEYVSDLKNAGLVCSSVGIDVFGITETVQDVSFFSDFVREHASNPELKARDFFSAQARELKTAFRLLVQVWLVAKGKKELGSVTAEIAKNIVDDPKFWAPVEVDNDLHPKLKEALGREDLLKGWTPRKPQDEDTNRLIKWAFPANL